MNQTEFLEITCNLLKAREKSRVEGAIGFGLLLARWLIIWRGIFKPITKRSNRNRVITFDSHLKATLSLLLFAAILCFPLTSRRPSHFCAPDQKRK